MSIAGSLQDWTGVRTLPNPDCSLVAEVTLEVPRVSVIMNCRNGADFLHEALDSLLAQTVNSWELIAWDDDSADDTCTILRSYNEERFRIFSAPRGVSLSAVRQAAIEQCRAEWIAFLDQDDIWLPHKLARQLEVADCHGDAAMVYGRALTFSDRNRGSFRDYDHRHAWSPLPEGSIFTALFEDSCFICMSSAMLRSSILRLLPAIPASIRLTPDYFFYLSIAQEHSAYAVQEPVCLYRQHQKNVSRQKWVEMHEECLLLVARFAPNIQSCLAVRRAGVHQSLIAFGLMLKPRTLLSGCARLIRHGSVSYFLSRFFVRAARLVKLAIVPQHWQHAPSSEEAHREPPFASQTYATGAEQVRVMGTAVSTGSFAGAQAAISTMVNRQRGGYVSNANVYSTMLARRSARLRRSFARASMVIADGMPIVWLLKAYGHSAERVHGDDLLFGCCAAFPHWRHYLVGGRSGQDQQVRDALEKRYPGICIAGTHATPDRPLSAQQTEAVIRSIEEARADIVWVGMGTPMQDYWMSDVSSRLPVAMVGVGSAFDLLSGRCRPTPQWMKQSGLQWLSRIVQEPRRLAKRYLYYNTLFLAVAMVESVRTYFKPPLTDDRTARRKSG